MIQLVRIVKNGNGIMVTIPRPMLRYLGWLPGEYAVLVVNDDKTLTLKRVTRESILDIDERPAAPAPASAPLV